MTDAEALKQYERLILKIARRHAKRHDAFGDLDDLLQAARLGLLKAVQTYDSKRGASFLTHAYTFVNAYVGHSIEKLSRYVVRPHRTDPNAVKNEYINPGDEFGHVEPDYTEAEIAQMQALVRKTIAESGLTKSQEAVMNLCVMDEDLTREQMGERLGITRQAVDGLRERAIAKIKEPLRRLFYGDKDV